MEGFTDLLRLLGATELDAAEYLTKHVAPVAAAGELDAELATAVLGLVDRHRSDLTNLRGALGRLPLVPCSDGVVRAADEVHLPNRALSLIAPDAPIADVGTLGEHLHGTLIWLGVSDHPSHQVLNEAARRLGEPDARPDPGVAAAILDALPNPPDADEFPRTLAHLRTAEWLPCEGGGRGRPDDVFATFQRYLFESQGKKLALASADQQRLNKVLDWLGVASTPTTAMVVAHLRYCSEHGRKMNAEVYRRLGEAKEEHLVTALRDERCIQIGDGEFVDPTRVFWSDPGLGDWAHVLSGDRRTFQAFHDRVGVTDLPTPAQLEKTLREISRIAGNDRLAEDDKRVVHRCWELLDESLTSASAELVRLGAIKCALGPRDVLEMPSLLLFADGRRLAEKIPLIQHNLIRREKTTYRALAAAGVCAAEDVIEAHVDPELEHTAATDLPAKLRDRMPALERLAEAQRTEAVDIDLSLLEDLSIDVIPQLAVEYVTRFAHQRYIHADPEVEAIYLARDHRLIVRTDDPSPHVARELALCIAPDLDASSLAPSITVVLTAKSLADANRALDDYGVRDLDAQRWAVVESQTTPEAGVDEDGEWSDDSGIAGARDGEHFDDPLQESPITSTADAHEGHHPGRGGTSADREKSKARRRQPTGQRRQQMASLVWFDEDDRDFDQEGDEAPKRTAVDAAGVAHVVAYERSCGRVPEEQAHNNPGYDVLSRNAAGDVVRRIEIKSIGGAWTGFGVWMSATQMKHNRESGNDYWLYVVEHADDPDAASLHRIQNPAAQATKYGFDAGWQAIREPDLERDDSGAPLTGHTRRLLGWNGDSVR